MLKTSAIFGATQGIGLAITSQLLDKGHRVYASYRGTSNLEGLAKLAKKHPEQLIILPLEIDNEDHYKEFFSTVSESTSNLDYCINCIGMLSKNTIQPERKIEDMELATLLHVFMVNTSPTLMIAKYAKPLMRSSETPVFCTLSAKVGSIGDNKMGGWHSYRISKAALNMALKNISLEFGRINKKSISIAIHPGTTNTALSEPFLETAAKRYKIHSSHESGKNILSVIETCNPAESNGEFYSWDGTKLPW